MITKLLSKDVFASLQPDMTQLSAKESQKCWTRDHERPRMRGHTTNFLKAFVKTEEKAQIFRN
jgi:hypothetical protein